MKHDAAPVPAVDPAIVGTVFTTEEVALMLKVSQRTVQDWIRSGILTAVRYGRLMRFKRTNVPKPS